MISLRSAGFDHVDVACAKKKGLKVAYVPSYSPSFVAEHAVTLVLALNRKIHIACEKVRQSDFTLDGLMGFELRGKTAGIIGTGKIGFAVSEILKAFGMKILAYDVVRNKSLMEKGVRYTDLNEVLSLSDIVSVHCPLNDSTRHLIDTEAVNQMKSGVMLINTARGGVVDTNAVINGLLSGKIGSLGIDVYENEKGIFFRKNNNGIGDNLLQQLISMKNVIITPHQAFLTAEALQNIAHATLKNISDYEKGRNSQNYL